MLQQVSCHFIDVLVVTLSCKYLFLDGGGGRNLASRRENGVNHSAERGHEPSTWPVSQKPKNNIKSQATRFVLFPYPVYLIIKS